MTWPLTYYIAVAALNGSLAAILGVFVCTRNPRDRRYMTYGIFCLSLTVWSFGYFAWLTSSTREAALFWVRFLMIGAVFIPITSYHHLVHLIETPEESKRTLISIGYISSLCLLPFCASSLMVSGVTEKLKFQFLARSRPNLSPSCDNASFFRGQNCV
jgi:N-terminal 7TM region of histidine kinase